MALAKRIITIAYAGLEKHAWKLVIQNQLFIEFNAPAALPTAMPSIDSSDVKPVAVLRNSKGLVLEVYNHTSADIIRSILEVLVHAE